MRVVMRECPRCDNELLLVGADGDFARARRCGCQSPCPTCGGIGYRFEADARGYEVAIPCRCAGVDRRVAHYNQAAIPARYAAASFHSFETPDTLRRTLKGMAYRFASEFTEGERGILYYGPCGTGKTHLLVAILRHLIVRRGLAVRFIEFMHLISALRAAFEDNKKAQSVMEPLVQVPVLAVDELGKGRGSEWELSVLDEIISKRYNARRTTLFTSNYFVGTAPEGQPLLEQRVGERIYSRLMEMCQAQLVGGEDFRRRGVTRSG